ncbi:MAG: hypothetical protein SP1CHLAM54_07440 [Chlamydiia bacterium]|nr:hypothetical protein [Chlamydiia bacterium]MCH9615650.1 hypothetical protein [Chlamydiia bacterium]MCH9628947.1 hypothetical protein [Chlamydiia bacterium]
MLGGGVFNIVRGEKWGLAQLEYRGALQIYQRSIVTIRPLIGEMVSFQGSTYTYAGIAFDCALPFNFYFTPTFSPGIYTKGQGKDLGYPLEYRSSVELSYAFWTGSRIGAQFYHLSNGSFSNKNPGTECLVLFYAFSL